MNSQSVRVRLRLPSNPPSYCFVSVTSSSLAELRWQVEVLLQRCLDSSDPSKWSLLVEREQGDSSKTYLVANNADVALLASQDLLIPSVLSPAPASELQNLRDSPLKTHSFGGSMQTVRLTECTNPVPLDASVLDNLPIWDSKDLLSASVKACQELCQSLQSNGFIFVRMTDQDLEIHRRSRQALAEFWRLPLEEKNKYYIGDISRRWGYRHLAYMRKEYFKFRKTHGMNRPANGILKNHVMAEYEMFNNILSHVMDCIGRHLGFQQELPDMLAFEPSRELSKESVTSFGEAFLYHDNPTDQYIEPCPIHSDMGLLTIIPPGDGPAALELFSWRNGWQNLECSKQMTSDPRVCVVFSGDLLCVLTNQFFQTTPHRVVIPPRGGPRHSVIFEILPRPDYVIDCTKLNSTIVGPSNATPMTSMATLLKISEGRVSVNSDY